MITDLFRGHRRAASVVLSVSTLEGLDTAARKGKHDGRPPVITDGMLHTVLRRRTGGATVEQIQPDLIIPTGKRKGRNPELDGPADRTRHTLPGHVRVVRARGRRAV